MFRRKPCSTNGEQSNWNLQKQPISIAFQIIGNKWKLLIIRNLSARTHHFNDIKNSFDGNSQKVLTENLKMLEEEGIVLRTAYTEIPLRLEYSLT